MNFYYEIKLNFDDEQLLEFYEWEANDNLDNFKKIPLIKISTPLLQKIYSSEFIISDEFLNSIKGKSIVKKGDLLTACIFCDTKNCIAIEFNDIGKSVSRSNLLLEDENNICEIAYSLKNRNIDISKIKEYKLKNNFRQEEKIKRIILTELKELYDNKDFEKLKYLYYEWFNLISEDYNEILKKSIEDLNRGITKEQYNIYNLIKLSYSNV